MSNPGADRVKRIARLAGRSARVKANKFLVEGPQAVREALRHGQVEQLYITESAAARHPDCVPGEHHRTTWWTCTDAVLKAMADSVTPQGVVAVCEMPTMPDISEVSISGFVVVLVDVQDPGNAGTIIRAADAAGAQAVVVVKGTTDVFGPKCVRSTVGSIFHVPVVTAVCAADVLSACAVQQCVTIATSGYADQTLPELQRLAQTGQGPLVGPHAWLVGNEGAGLPDEVVRGCAQSVRVPLYGQAESLNVAMAATICSYASATVTHDLAI